MKVKSFYSFLLLIALVATTIMPMTTNAATDLADGEYSISYTVLHSDNDSASIANDYWEKPAKIIVEDGKMVVQMTINHSSWVTEFKVHNQDVKVLSTDQSNDKRTVQFPVNDLSNPLAANIHVVVKDINYDHGYTIRFSFEQNSIQALSVPQSNNTNTNTNSSNSESETEEVASGSQSSSSANNVTSENVSNPQTSDTTQIVIFIILIVLTGFVLMRNFKAQKI
ncbi:heme uptake protein IsdC [Alkalihalobacillus sp. 1P02AB]|uniref:heme uptake protein IsdC n=1 Tax=Alkalihalobacillus sp. 1P02AB TaxID=3132260 RepID=UPI0039A48EC6